MARVSPAPQEALPAAYTVIATAWHQHPPVGRFAPPVTVMGAPVEGVRMTVKMEGPPQLIPRTVNVYAPAGTIDCGTTT